MMIKSILTYSNRGISTSLRAITRNASSHIPHNFSTSYIPHNFSTSYIPHNFSTSYVPHINFSRISRPPSMFLIKPSSIMLPSVERSRSFTFDLVKNCDIEETSEIQADSVLRKRRLKMKKHKHKKRRKAQRALRRRLGK